MDHRVIRNGNVFMHKDVQNLILTTADGSRTMLELLQNRVKTTPLNPFLGTISNGDITYLTYSEVMALIVKLAHFFESVTRDHDIIGIYSVNRTDWVIAEYASYLVNCTNCPLYSSFSVESLENVLNETELKIIVASADKAQSMLESILVNKKYNLKHVILMDYDLNLKAKFEAIGISVEFLKNIYESEGDVITRAEPQPSDIATICYTSGTSGMSKGVIITHENFLAAVGVFNRNMDPKDYVIIKECDTYISYLPLAHVLERICFSLVVSCSAKIGFFGGDPKNLQSDFKIIKPVFVVAVPRVLNIFKEKIEASIAAKNFVVRWLFKAGLKYKIWRQKSGIYKSYFLDKFIFNKVAIQFGGQIGYCLSGGAALDPEVGKYLQAMLSCKIFQGWGQTEGLGANIVQPMDCCEDGTVGIPFYSTQIKLEKLEDYPDDQGQILMKGPSITQGYFKRPEETKDLFTADGWLKTGDVGKEKNGLFYIVGRIKEIFKTSFGEYIIPEKIENLLSGGAISDVYITVRNYGNYLLAIVVCTDMSKSEAEILTLIKSRGDSLVKQQKMCRYEIPSHVVILRQPFMNLENGNLITPSLKKRRPLFEKLFADQINMNLKSK